MPPPRHRVRHHAVNPDRPERQSDRATNTQERCHEVQSERASDNRLLHRPHVVDCQQRID